MRRLKGVLNSPGVNAMVAKEGEKAVSLYTSFAPRGKTFKLSEAAYSYVKVGTVYRGAEERAYAVVRVSPKVAPYAASVEFGHNVANKPGKKTTPADTLTRVLGALK